ncbi:MAG: FAD-dependent oxidoreductase [Candidatus Onthovivens sp.]|nr:FAD-dependent oxidoreductase [Candidatus Onthovivens sp.]
MKIIKDVGIIGAGPAGMSAALYLARSKYSFLLIEKEMSGGKLNITTQIENYPGVGSIDGFTLGMNMRNQLKSFNISIKKDNCIDVKKVDEGFEVIGEKDTYLFKILIIATGSKTKGSGIKDEEKYYGKGISFCAVCDGFLYKNKDVAVFASSRKGYLEALYLANIVNKVYLINDNNSDDEEDNLDKLKSLNNVEFLYPFKIKQYIGEERISGVEIENINTKETKTIDISCVFPFIGDQPSTYFLSKLGVETNKGYIITNKFMETNIKNCLAIGDVIDKPLRQVVTACSDGSIAATRAIHILNGMK